ncbi:S8 family serine peptidase [Actinoplanes sp. NPDC051861]|uniref:S8 family serine peptidase n=1 Tax=Actinoplanes sp. NPDC051861 TaxID=3155170 RepID=UPI00342ED065
MKRIAAFCLSSLLLIGLGGAPAAAADTTTFRLVVGVVADTDPAAVVAPLGDRASEPHKIPGLDAFTVDITDREAVLATLGADPAVRYVEQDAVVRANIDPFEGTNRQAGFWNQLPAAWTWTTGSPSVTVAVVDSGVTANADLAQDRLAPGYDFVDGDDNPADDDNHGTLIANTIGAAHGNGAGGLGVCGQCRIMPVRVLSDRASGPAEGFASNVAAGIVWAAEHDAQIINLSLSTVTATRSRVLEDAVQSASGAGALLVAAAGNDLSSARRYPAAIEPVLAVGATLRGTPANTTNVNPDGDRWIDVGAYSTYTALNASSAMQVASGTSVSAALVSGVAALGLSVKPGTSAADLRSAIVETATRSDVQDPADPPVLDAAGVLTAFGARDDVAPKVNPGFANRQLLRAGAFTVPVTGTDDRAVARYELEVDGDVKRRNRLDSPFRITPPEGRDSEVTYTVRAYDYAGNVDEASRTVLVDGTPPTGTIDSPAEGAIVPGGMVDVVFTSSNDERLTSVRANEIPLTQVSTRQWTGRVTPDPLGRIYLNVFDVAGNMTDLSRTVVVDDAAPTGDFDWPAEGAYVRGPVEVGFTVARDEKLQSITVNGAPMSSVGLSSWQAVVTPPASGVLEVVATDQVGHVSRFVRKVVFDNTAPTVASITPGYHQRIRSDITTTLSGVQDANGVLYAELWANGEYKGEDRTAPYSMRIGSTSSGYVMLTWRVTDRLGNYRNYYRQVIADNTMPSVSIAKAPKNRAKVKGTVKVYVKASDASGISRVELIVNGKVVSRDYKAGYVLSVNTKKQKRTMHVQVRAYDRVGNLRYTTIRTWFR